MKKKIKLAIVDDTLLFRKGLISLINEFDKFEIIIEASSGKELIGMLQTKKPDVLLLDIQMPDMNGILVSEYLQKHHPEIRILALSLYNDETIIQYLIKYGVRGFLLKDDDIITLVDAIGVVLETGYYFNNRVSKSMVQDLVSNKKINLTYKSAALSEREIEIVKLICKEQTNKEIAAQLFISYRTVDGHKDKILRKTKAKNVIGIVMYAVKNNLL